MIKLLVIDDDIGAPFNVYHKDFIKLYGGIEDFEFVFCDGRNKDRKFDLVATVRFVNENSDANLVLLDKNFGDKKEFGIHMLAQIRQTPVIMKGEKTMTKKAKKNKYDSFREELRESLQKTGKMGNVDMEEGEYNAFKARVKNVPENGADMNGIVYDFLERMQKLGWDRISSGSGTPYLHNLLKDCGLDVPRKVVDALRSNTERLIWEQKRIKQFLAAHPEFKNALG